MHNAFYISLLHLFLPGGTQLGPPDLTVAGENQEYEIDKIVSHKKTRGMTVYQIRWWAYDAMKDIWLREKDLDNDFDLL